MNITKELEEEVTPITECQYLESLCTVMEKTLNKYINYKNTLEVLEHHVRAGYIVHYYTDKKGNVFYEAKEKQPIGYKREP